jgi:hypothetical protein
MDLPCEDNTAGCVQALRNAAGLGRSPTQVYARRPLDYPRLPADFAKFKPQLLLRVVRKTFPT